MSEWVNMVKERLGSEDQMQKNYYANFERTAGFIVMSNKKLLFIEEKGFLHKTHNIILEIPYEKIREIAIVDPYKLAITDVEGKRHTFSIEAGASWVEAGLRELMPVPGATP